jgi:hypothetical protein
MDPIGDQPPGFRQRAVPVPRRSPCTAQMRVDPPEPRLDSSTAALDSHRQLSTTRQFRQCCQVDSIDSLDSGLDSLDSGTILRCCQDCQEAVKLDSSTVGRRRRRSSGGAVPGDLATFYTQTVRPRRLMAFAGRSSQSTWSRDAPPYWLPATSLALLTGRLARGLRPL